MNYELAKQLKDAGFPQIQKGRVVLEPELLPVLEPTLSELIEACGEEFGSLNQLDDETYPEQWSASIYNELDKCVIGSTPEEAVANLWLAINNK